MLPTFGPQLARLRRRRGLSQQQLAEQLCAVSGTPTISRNEISRWERGVRVPAQPWLAWLAVVLRTSREELPAVRRSVSHAPDPARRRWAALREKLFVARPGIWTVPTID